MARRRTVEMRRAVDAETGEALTVPVARYRFYHDPPWVRLFRDEWGKLLAADMLTRSELRVLLHLVVTCEWGNWVEKTQKEIGHALLMSESAVSVVMRKLVDCGYILRQAPLKGRTWLYRIPSSLAHYGSPGDLAWKRPRDLAKQTQQRQNAMDSTSLRQSRQSICTESE